MFATTSTSEMKNTPFYIETKDIELGLYSPYVPYQWDSLFLPALPSIFTDETVLRDLFEYTLKIGKVKRVDIVAKPDGGNRKMAFIHFDHWNKTRSIEDLRSFVATHGQADIAGIRDANGMYHGLNNLFYDKKRVNDRRHQNRELFVRIMMNKTPIKETELNIHQLADSLEMAEKVIHQQKEQIENLNANIENIQKQLDFMTKFSTQYSNHVFNDFVKYCSTMMATHPDDFSELPAKLSLSDLECGLARQDSLDTIDTVDLYEGDENKKTTTLVPVSAIKIKTL
jgi:hypothetical protein